MTPGKHKLFFKCENFQRGGSFKIRGATNALLSVGPETAAKGVVTHSSGNHAQACALAAKACGVQAHIVMPMTAPQVKKDAVRGYGARIIECKQTERAATAAQVETETGAFFIHPSNEPLVIAGQGTIALELFDQVVEMREGKNSDQSAGRKTVDPPLDVVVIPLGGGGMTSGMCAAIRGLYGNHVTIVAAEPAGADDAHRSKLAGKLLGHTETGPDTIADGLRTTLGCNTWPFVRDYVDHIIPISESAIIHGMSLIYQRMKLVIEPSAGVGIAAVLSEEFQTALGGQTGLRVGVVLCGGNVDLRALGSLFSREEDA